MLDCNQPDMSCSELDAECIDCEFDKCRYGENVTVTCSAKNGVVCKVNYWAMKSVLVNSVCVVNTEIFIMQDNIRFQREMVCQYCYQTPIWQQVCTSARMCISVSAPKPMYR
jgi:hypothetical protein